MNRWANVVAGSVMTVVQIGSLFVVTAPQPHSVLSSILEIAGAVFVVAYALARKRDA